MQLNLARIQFQKVSVIKTVSPLQATIPEAGCLVCVKVRGLPLVCWSSEAITCRRQMQG